MGDTTPDGQVLLAVNHHKQRDGSHPVREVWAANAEVAAQWRAYKAFRSSARRDRIRRGELPRVGVSRRPWGYVRDHVAAAPVSVALPFGALAPLTAAPAYQHRFSRTPWLAYAGMAPLWATLLRFRKQGDGCGFFEALDALRDLTPFAMEQWRDAARACGRRKVPWARTLAPGITMATPLSDYWLPVRGDTAPREGEQTEAGRGGAPLPERPEEGA